MLEGKKVVLTKGRNSGKHGTVVAEGTFQVFDRVVTGIKVDVGQAGLLVIPYGEFKEAAGYVRPVGKDDKGVGEIEVL